ncbi:MAG: DoxX family protein [Pirellulaceae bacterium]
MQSQKIMSIAGWVLSGLLGAALVMSAVFKFFPPEAMVKEMKDSPLLSWILIIGIGELVSTVLFLVPRTAMPGTLLLSSYFGGAIVAHMMQRESILVPAIFLVVIWIAATLRLPELWQRLLGIQPTPAPSTK